MAAQVSVGANLGEIVFQNAPGDGALERERERRHISTSTQEVLLSKPAEGETGAFPA